MPTHDSAAPGVTGTTCPCGRGRASYSHRLGRPACARCFFSSIPAGEREASDQGWARRDLAGQVRAVAKRLPNRDPRAGRLFDLALDLELAGSDHAAAPVIGDLRVAGLRLALRNA
jgi:hypothetical protein